MPVRIAARSGSETMGARVPSKSKAKRTLPEANLLRTDRFLADRMFRIKPDLPPSNVPPGGRSTVRGAAGVPHPPACVPPSDTR